MKRREFLRDSLLAGGGLTLSFRSVANEVMGEHRGGGHHADR